MSTVAQTRGPDVAPRSVIHVAVIFSEYLDWILEGRKTVESRLSRHRVAPFGAIQPGDCIYFKERGGAVRASAVASSVLSFGDLSPRSVRQLRRQYNHLLLGPAAYWAEKVSARYATLIWLKQVEEIRVPIVFPPFHGAAWRTLSSRG